MGSLELARLVAEVILSLPEAHRQVIHMRYLEELDATEISTRLGIPAGTVRWRLKMAMDEVRARLDARDPEEGRRWRRLLAPMVPPAAAKVVTGAGFLSPLTLATAGLLAVVTLGGAAAVRARWARSDAPAAAAAEEVTLPESATRRRPASPPPLALAAVAPGEDEARTDPFGAAVGDLAPFTGVRWRGDLPEVEVDGVWGRLVSIDGLPADRIVAFAQQRYTAPGLWQKRISEDLVEVLTAMGHPPRQRVSLVTASLTDGQLATTEAPMTRNNRRQVWARNRAATGAAAEPRPLVDRFARVAPFAGFRYRGEDVDVQLAADAPWLRLVAIGGVPVAKIVAHTKATYGARWRKRIAEDLVEVMRGLGVTANDEVDLTLRDAAGRLVERPTVPMTEENRRRVKETWEEASR